ncbi:MULTISPECIES: spore protease YyaC [Brevibacillus]|jgi:putative sporulation protein YyaC|uniref:spore protease YyaC n=1 Tax=Brevibacillus TaxID=55080 RepID=UPI0004F24E75|nr:spore protease YyaC [Brevibacillus borstelensis]KKX55048.1 sporulation protein [Brevibacillus borstelensis cifa_chp40]MBE5396080.1 spore protease YyaC [Brevibacillus borstelensis]MCM3472316.1 spore protease YyaC [Brevibacillus borstelensis]MCM3625042.1 spore protease YyaC [Brevibacillus borstelensis]MED1742474.1 spore protease YyaC [Brevibacillus borstelensis]
MNLSDNCKEQLLPPLKVDYRNETAVDQLAQHLVQRFHSHMYSDEIVIVCIGTDRSTGDALGPLVGSKLLSYKPLPLHVYGTLEDPVHAMNLSEKLEAIRQEHPHSLIIAIDACLGQFSNVGNINVIDGPLKPGAGVKKELPAVGTFHITGIVNVGGFMEYFVLQNTRLYVVMRMAEIIAAGLFKASLLHSSGDSQRVSAFPE